MAPAGGPVDDSDCILKVYTCFTPFKRFIVSTGNMLVIQCAPAVFQKLFKILYSRSASFASVTWLRARTRSQVTADCSLAVPAVGVI